MPLIPSNDPDVALAEEWLGELEGWLDRHGTVGFDPFDIKAHPALRAVQKYPVLRKASTVMCDLAPHLARRMLHIEPTENPKTHALLALGKLRLFQLTGDQPYLDGAEGHLSWLEAHRNPAYENLCWGYPFPLKAQGLDVPANAPVCVVSAIAGEAFLLGFEVTGNEAWRDAAESIARHFLQDVPSYEKSPRSRCFHYGSHDSRLVHNANLLVAQHLLEVAVIVGDEAMARTAIQTVQFTLGAQRPDGAFPYGYSTTEDSFEESLLQVVDHHHTGFVLRSLAAINRHAENKVIEGALRRGYAYYRASLCATDGMPRTEKAIYPVNIHACAEAILCPAVLASEIMGAKKQAILALRWAWYAMRDPKTGAPYYRKYKGFTSTITYPRWGVAWMYRALAEYLWRFGERG